jgi:hypothetical protein
MLDLHSKFLRQSTCCPLHQAEIYPLGIISEDTTLFRPLLKAEHTAASYGTLLKLTALFLSDGEKALSFLYMLQLATMSAFTVIKGYTKSFGRR